MEKGFSYGIIFTIFFIILSSFHLQCEELTYEEFWDKFKYSFKLLYLDEKNFNEFLKYTNKNKGKKEFSQKLQREILDSIDLLNKSSNDTYVFPPMKSVYEKIITDTKITLKIDLREYQKDDRMVFIKEYSEEPSDFGHIPYFCVLKIPKCFKFPKNVDVYEYLENKPEFIKYKKSLQRLLKNLDNYKFNMDEYGVIWVYHKK